MLGLWFGSLSRCGFRLFFSAYPIVRRSWSYLTSEIPGSSSSVHFITSSGVSYSAFFPTSPVQALFSWRRWRLD